MLNLPPCPFGPAFTGLLKTETTQLTRGRFIGSALFNPFLMKWFAASRLRTD